MDNKLLFKQTFGHFCVDATCASVIISGTNGLLSIVQFFILYNFLAFCLQPLAGILLDRIKKVQYSHYIIGSFVLLLVGFFPFLNIWGQVVLVGFGNCLFHTGAGQLILVSSKNKMAPLGIFVSSGAVGLLLGTIFAYNPVWKIILVLFLLVLILLNLDLPQKTNIRSQRSIFWSVVIALCICITIRSFMGFLPLTHFLKTPLILLLITMGVFMGKSLGGILCDKWGIRPVIILSTLFVIGLFLFSFQNPFLWTLVQMIINLSMPITLYLMYKSMQKYPAFSFGLAASFLVVGLLLTFIFKTIKVPPACFLLLFVLNSSIILWAERKLK